MPDLLSDSISVISITSNSSRMSAKARPPIISPFMPFSTQVSIDPRENECYQTYGSTSSNLQESNSSSSDNDDETESLEEEPAKGFIRDWIDNIKSFNASQLITIAILCSSNLCSTTAFSCIAPFYPAVAKSKLLSETQTGIVFGIFEFVMFLTAPFLGVYIHRFGIFRMYIFGQIMTGITAIIFGSFIRIFETFGDAAFVTSSFVIAVNQFPKNVAFVLALMETFAGLGYSVGPMIGGILYDMGGFMVPFLILGLVLIVNTMCGAMLIKYKSETIIEDDGKGILAMLKIRDIWLSLFAVFCCAVSLSYLDPALPPHLETFKLSTTQIGFMFFLSGGSYAVSSPLLGPLVDHYNHGTLLTLVGAIFTAIGLLLIGPSPLFNPYLQPSLIYTGVALFILGISSSCLYVPAFQMCLDSVKEHDFKDNYRTYGCISGIFQSAFGFGSFIGPTLGSYLSEQIAFAWTTTVVSILPIVLFFLLILNYSAKRCSKD
ncbi:unnamed protein product [Caenorhabditis bovis]|uniref:Major facilitator superfamily (MFS) profile domain-containing protein n=1 Tax=Caenorhabditis bovis TaxID=2654633 RepID=A0A8S1EM40_9PELO|nr:unnamed protein product [Caenorhabditis bovis]